MDMEQIKPAIEASLLQFWNARSIEVDETSESVDDFAEPLDSLTAVEALIETDKIVGMPIPEGRVIRRGGYYTKAQFIEHLTKCVLTYVAEQPK